MTSEPIILVRDGDPDARPQLYACGKCGRVHSPNIYMARDEVRHSTALNAAINCYECREHNKCTDCGAIVDKHLTRCRPCRDERAIAKATKVEPSTIAECFGVVSDEFYRDIDEALEAGEQWVFAAEFRPFRLNTDWVLDTVLDDHHEDASTHDLIGVAELLSAVEKFNTAQKSGSFDVDNTRVAFIGDHHDG